MNWISASVLLYVLASCLASKYAANKNRIPDFTDEDNPFRMRKINMIWQKARKRLSGSELADLYADLKVQDKHEAALKKIRVDDMDKDGQQQAEVDMALREIMEQYGLEDMHYEQRGHREYPVPPEKQMEFKDKKLKSMWRRAERAGYTGRDLQKLREEFRRQQDEIDRMEMLRAEWHLQDGYDNEVEGEPKPGRMEEQRKQELKMLSKNIKAGYYKLEDMMEQSNRQELEFHDHRVLKLWAMAKKTDWAPTELESFKEELRHFERRLRKYEYHEEELKQSKEGMQDGMTKTEHKEKQKMMEERVTNMGHMIKKLHDELKMRVSKAFESTKHTEL